MRRSSSSDSVIGSMGRTNGLDEEGTTVASVMARPHLRDDALRLALTHEAEHVTGDPAHLDLLRSLGDAVTAVGGGEVVERGVSPRAAAAPDPPGPGGGP